MLLRAVNGMVDRKLYVPLYVQIAEKLAERLNGREPHSLFTSENEVMREFNVSRGTARSALDRLVEQGRLYRVVGRGTFVSNTPPIRRSFDHLPSFKQDILNRGMKPGAQVITLAQELPDERLRNELRLSAGQKVWRIERVRTADEKPVGFLISLIPTHLLPRLTVEDVSESLYEAMDRAGVRPTWAHDLYGATAADAKLSRLTDVPEGAPLVYSERTSYVGDSTPVERAISYLRSDRFQIQVDINRPCRESQKS